MAFWAACGTRHANWCCPSTSSVNLENFHFSPKIAKLASLTVVTILRYLKKLNMLWTHKLVKTRPDHITSWEKSCQTNGCEAVAILSERSSRCTFFLCTRKSKKNRCAHWTEWAIVSGTIPVSWLFFGPNLRSDIKSIYIQDLKRKKQQMHYFLALGNLEKWRTAWTEWAIVSGKILA